MNEHLQGDGGHVDPALHQCGPLVWAGWICGAKCHGARDECAEHRIEGVVRGTTQVRKFSEIEPRRMVEEAIDEPVAD
jgi:hypothetical protein